MKKIDAATEQRIKDAVDIVDVVSDFVRLKKRGSNYIGLCPFHAERTPSFSVSKSRGYCKCFSCGKGGTAISFVMEHENMNYNEALRYLAKKYNIEIIEKEVSEADIQAEHERESLFAVNEWAMNDFCHILLHDEEGIAIGKAYFTERGLNESTIRKYNLGYALEKRDNLSSSAIKAGYSEKYLLESGLCYANDNTGKLTDRFRGRVIFPVMKISGKVVAFGGRTLKTDKSVAKYVNSPESLIYSKSNELYGLYQAKSAIVKKGFCLLVEGYMDVLSMAQAGIDNIVASSGTSLTINQIRLLHRFTDKVTLMYDNDPAGIKAAVRGVDLLLSEGIDLSVVLLPEGDDPDSFAQSHSSAEISDYLDSHSEDFIKFKIKVLLGEAGNDPIERSKVINEIIRSIACIPDEIKRAVYCQEGSRLMDVSEDMLARHISSVRLKKLSEQKSSNSEILVSTTSGTTPPAIVEPRGTTRIENLSTQVNDAILEKLERDVLKYIVRYGFVYFFSGIDSENNIHKMTVLETIADDLRNDNIEFCFENNKRLYDLALRKHEEWGSIYKKEEEQALVRKSMRFKSGLETIKAEATTLTEISHREEELEKDVNEKFEKEMSDFAEHFLSDFLLNHNESDIRNLATDLAIEKHQLSRYHTRFNAIPSELERLEDLLGKALNAWKYGIINKRIILILNEIQSANERNDEKRIIELLQEKVKLDKQKTEFGQLLGDRVVVPPLERGH